MSKDIFLLIYEREGNIINRVYLYIEISSSIIHAIIYIIQIIRFEGRAVIGLEV